MGKVYCHICKKRCKGDVLKVHDKFIHKSCFQCCNCKTSLEKGGFFLKEEKYYCKKDYLEKFGVKCQVCNGIAEGEVIVIFATTFHPNCFKCKNCFAIFQRGDKVTLCNGDYLCYNCIFKQTCNLNERTQVEPDKADEIQSVKRENKIEDLDTMTTSLISTIVSDSETESITPEKRNLLERSMNIVPKRPKLEISLSRHSAPDDNQSSDSECLSIRTEPEMYRNSGQNYQKSMRNSDITGSTSSLKPSESPTPYGRFYNFSYLRLEEQLKSQIHPRAIYKTPSSNISTSSTNLQHYHKIDNFSYRNSSNVTINKRSARTQNLVKIINGKKPSAIVSQSKDSNKPPETNTPNLVVAKSILINGSRSPVKTEASAASMIDISTTNSSTADIYLSQNKTMSPMKSKIPTAALDPISASRVPNANYEPVTKPRYEIHMFTSPSRNINPQDGSLSQSQLLNPENISKDLTDSNLTLPPPQINSGFRNKPMVTRSQVICSKPPEHDYISVQSFLRSFSREKLSDDRKPKTYPYDLLKISNFNIPKGVDRSKLEIYLPDEEFERLFKLTRIAFNRLPEWKRNDLKKRVDLF